MRAWKALKPSGSISRARKTAIVAVIMTLSNVSAHADIFTYACKVKGKSSTVKIDDVRKTLQWRGKLYKLSRELTTEECAKFGWRAEREGVKPIEFCTATQGYADFQDGGATIQCDLRR